MADSTRLDKWLWAARFFKTRSLAQRAVRGGKVEINGDHPKASRLVRVGDELKITRGELVFEVKVDEIRDKRVSAPIAREMYTEAEEGRKRREAVLEDRKRRRGAGEVPAGRPDKRQRRQIRKFRGQ